LVCEAELGRPDIEAVYPTIDRRIVRYVDESPTPPTDGEPMRTLK
jgi:hypothetical protein